MREHAELLLSLALVGCSSSVDEGVAVDAVSDLIVFSAMYSAFDGTHEYAVTPNVPSAAPSSEDEDPVMAASIKWELDEAFVKREGLRDWPAAIKLTTKKDGVTMVGVMAKTLSGHALRGEAKLTITRSNESEWEAGDARYNNGQQTPRNRPPIIVDGKQCPTDLTIELPTYAACCNCHNATSQVTFEQTPTQTARYSNEELIKIFSEGEKPADGFKSQFLSLVAFPECVYKDFHTWQMSDEQKRGLVWKLRSIPPKAHDAEAY